VNVPRFQLTENSRPLADPSWRHHRPVCRGLDPDTWKTRLPEGAAEARNRIIRGGAALHWGL